jgi:hypothetical protein
MNLSPIAIIGMLLVAGLLLAILFYRRWNKTSSTTKPPEYLAKYAEHVMAACVSTENAGPDVTAIVEKYRNPVTTQQITWGELFAVEAFVLRQQPEVALRRRAWSLREKFREVVGARQYDNYLLSNPPTENDDKADVSLLRADLERLLGALHWSYSLIPVRERLRAQIITFVSIAIAVWAFLAVGLLLAAAQFGQHLLATLVLVMLGGALGGFVSLLRRIQQVPTGGDPLVNIFELENGRVSLYLAPLSGALFALVLFMIFQAGLVQGSLFPKVLHLHLQLWQFAWAGQIIEQPEYAKLMVWSFIAGFAEQLVPDTLARLVERGEEASTAARTAPPPGQTSDGGPRGLAIVTSPPAANGDATSTAGQPSPPLPPAKPRITVPFK